MQSAWRVVDCTNAEGQLQYERGRMRVRCAGHAEPVDIPLSQLAVLLLGLKANCSTALLYELAQNGVSVLLCDWRGVPVGALENWSNPTTTVVRRQRAQVALSAPRRKNAWMRIVKAKIRGQAHALDVYGCDGGDLLRSLARSVRSGDVSNAEGQAAREYWKRFFPDSSFRRIPGGGTGRNAQLDYAYAVLRGFVVKAVLSAGLSPVFGVNHHNRSNYFCLADDLIEPYRPAIDAKVAQLDSDAPVDDRETKKFLVDAVNAQFNDSGLTIPSSANDFAQQFGLYCEGDIDVLPVPTFGGCNEKG